MSRTVIAFTVAPIVYGAFLLILGAIGGEFREGIWALIFAASISYPATMVLGVPTYLVLRKLNHNSLGAYLIAGMVLSIGPTIALIVYPRYDCFSNGFCVDWIDYTVLRRSFDILVATLITVGSFWFLARPDKSLHGR